MLRAAGLRAIYCCELGVGRAAGELIARGTGRTGKEQNKILITSTWTMDFTTMYARLSSLHRLPCAVNRYRKGFATS